MRHPEFPIVSFLAIPLLLSSLPSHIRSRSVATIALLAWLAVLNAIRGVNSLMWANNTVVRAEIWCDISTKIVIGFTFAVPLSALCICRHLENVSSNRRAIITEADKTRRMKFEALMCFGLPLIFMALHYIVQGHRFDLIEDVGCYPSTYFSVPAVIVVWVPPLVISLISLVYAVLAFHHFFQRRIEFAAILRSSDSAISPARYFRLMALAMFEILWDSGTNIYILYYNTFTGLRPWISWEDVHSNFSRVALFPRFILPPWAVIQLVWQWWIIPVSSIAFFLFFGFGEEAMSDYRAAFLRCRRAILCHALRASDLNATPAVLPVHRFTSNNINVALSAPSYDASDHEKWAWDEMSFVIPSGINVISHPRSVESLNGRSSSYCQEGTAQRGLSFTNHRTSSFSQPRRSISINDSGSENSLAPMSDNALESPPSPQIPITACSQQTLCQGPWSEPEITISQAYPSGPDVAFH